MKPLLTVLALAYLSSLSQAITIKRVIVPKFVPNATSSIDLICEFVHNPRDEQIIVKWYHNDIKTTPIFQWIPEADSFSVEGILKEKVNIEEARAKASNGLPSRSVITIHNPTIEQEGDYFCYVTSVANSDHNNETLTVYVPPAQVKFYYNMEKSSLVCRVMGVYPKMEVSMFSKNRKGDLDPIDPNQIRSDDVELGDTGTYTLYRRKFYSVPPKEEYQCWISLDDDTILHKEIYTGNIIVETDDPLNAATSLTCATILLTFIYSLFAVLILK